MSEKNYYEILGVRPGADGNAVHRSYWQLARKYQALAPSDPRAAQLLDDLNEAYGVLGTPALREQYDAALPASPAHEAGGSHGSRRTHAGILPWRRKARAEGVAAPDITESTVPARREPGPSLPRHGRRDIEDLRYSTASIVGRLRKSAAPDVLRTKEPDTTLVDIFQSERAMEEPEEPLTAMMDVLRGAREPANTR